MNINTGEIRFIEADKVIDSDKPIVLSSQWIPVDESQMTDKQKETMQVSKYDSGSELGKLFGANRAERRRQAKEERRRK